jgi:hypothetical protein
MNDLTNVTPIIVEGAGPLVDGASAYISLPDLRAAHSELLRRDRANGATAGVLDEIVVFLRRGAATGVVLDSDNDRQLAQSLLDYWSGVLYRRGEELRDTRLAEYDPALAPTLPDALCPYVGLDAFGEDSQNRFFGRQELIEQVISLLKDRRLLVVVGVPGSGKSSVVLGGLVPALRAGRLLPGSQDWRYLGVMAPGSEPLERLARLLRPAGVDEATWTKEQVERFRRDEGHLARLIADAGKEPALLVVDQFEDVFTLCGDETARQAFAANLAGLARASGTPHRVILTMRGDYAGLVARLGTLQPLFAQGTVQVTALSASELREAIERPAAAVGLKFADGVVAALIKEVLDEPAALPLLQFTLLKLWEQRERNRITIDAYHRLGGARGALVGTAEDLVVHLTGEEQETARRILLRLVRLTERQKTDEELEQIAGATPAEGREQTEGPEKIEKLEVTPDRERRQTLYQIGVARDRVDQVLGRLIDARLVRLTNSDTPADDQVELVHEALVRSWPRLLGWLEEAGAALERRSRLTVAAQEWNARGRDPGALWGGSLLKDAQGYTDASELETAFIRASKKGVAAGRRLRWLWKVLAAALVVVSVVAGVALQALRNAEQDLRSRTAQVQDSKTGTVRERAPSGDVVRAMEDTLGSDASGIGSDLLGLGEDAWNLAKDGLSNGEDLPK